MDRKLFSIVIFTMGTLVHSGEVQSMNVEGH